MVWVIRDGVYALARMTQRMIEQKTEALLAAFRERIGEATTGTGGPP